MKEFVQGLDANDLKSGRWFEKLIAHSLTTYAEKVDWAYFQAKYPGVPADQVVQERIKMAVRYAGLEGGITASVYTGAVAATVGSLGGASPLTVPAAFTTFAVDVAYLSQLQMKLAHDISVLYGVPLDINDPEDLWKLIRVAFSVKGGEFLRGGAAKMAPAFVRPLLKRYYSRGVLAAAKTLPVVGRHLLQRSVIKFAMPLVGVPIAVAVNRVTTRVAGNHAVSVFRSDALMFELAADLAEGTQQPRLLLWAAWTVVSADTTISDRKSVLLRHLVSEMSERHGLQDRELERRIGFDWETVERVFGDADGELAAVFDAAVRIARVDGEPGAKASARLARLKVLCGV